MNLYQCDINIKISNRLTRPEFMFDFLSLISIKSEYFPDIQQSHTADQPKASWGRATEQLQAIHKTIKAKQTDLSFSSTMKDTR